jgi:hypothetical protein
VESERSQLIRDSYERWSRDEPAVAPPPDEYEFHPAPDLLGEGVYRGAAAMTEFSAALAEIFEWLRIEPLGFEEHGAETLVRVHLTAKGRSSGIDVEREEFHLWTFGPKGPVKLLCFTAHADAVAAAQEASP